MRAATALAGALLTLLLAGAGLPGPSPGEAKSLPASACASLIKDIDEAVAVEGPKLEKARRRLQDPADDNDDGDYAFVNLELTSTQACWEDLGGRQAPPAALAASERLSRLSLAIFDLDVEEETWTFLDLESALQVERAMGFDGPVSQAMRQRGPAMLMAPGATLKDAFDLEPGELKAPDVIVVNDVVIDLTAICLMDPKHFAAEAAGLGIGAEWLASKPSRLTTDTRDLGWLVYSDAQMARVLRDCPV